MQEFVHLCKYSSYLHDENTTAIKIGGRKLPVCLGQGWVGDSSLCHSGVCVLHTETRENKQFPIQRGDKTPL